MTRDALLDQIYGSVGEPARWPHLLANLSDDLDSIGGMLVYNASPGGKNLIMLGRLDPEYNDVFHKFHVWNPWTLALKNQPFDRAVVSGSLVDRRIVHKTAFYADVLAPQKIQDLLCISHQALAIDGGVGGIAFALSARGADRAEQNRRRLQHLAPHLCRALDATLRLGPLVDGHRQLTRMLQLMSNAALLLDRRARIVHANPTAEQLLRDADGLTYLANDGLHLSAVMPQESAALSRALVNAVRISEGGNDELGEPLRLTRLSGAAPLLVVPVPLPPPAFPLWELSKTARVLVLVVDSSTQNPSAASTLRTGFGLTTAEARVATLVGSGLSGPQAAQVLRISPATVKTHLARCFEKMSIHSQVELARMLSSLPAAPSTSNGNTSDRSGALSA
jgi:DNA-binding CsgD family transcriptional regulator